MKIKQECVTGNNHLLLEATRSELLLLVRDILSVCLEEEVDFVRTDGDVHPIPTQAHKDSWMPIFVESQDEMNIGWAPFSLVGFKRIPEEG